MLRQLKKIAEERPLYIWGTGSMGTIIKRVFKNIPFKGFITSEPQSRTHADYPLFRAEDVLSQAGDFFIVIAVSPQCEDELISICHAHGLIKNLDFISTNDFCRYNWDDEVLKSFAAPSVVSADSPPPNRVPEHLWAGYTMQGTVPHRHCYLNLRGGNGVVNTAATYASAFEMLDKRTLKYYGQEINAFYDLLEQYDFKGKTVAVWGLDGCNCEAMALWKGAGRVYVIDYNKPVCEHEKITVANHQQWLELGLKTDLAFSFSSFEHDGLGMYGDPLDPEGDLKAMKTAWDSLKDGGLLFLGLPMGQDCLIWNMHRVYGYKRLPLMLKGWSCEAVFSPYEHQSPDFPFDQPFGWLCQPLLVLRKISDDLPVREELLTQIKATAGLSASPRTDTRDNSLLLRILLCVAEQYYPALV